MLLPPRVRNPVQSVATILLVDDADVVRKSAARCLRRAGYVVLEARDAGEALSLLAENGDQIDLLLTDLVLPAMGGAQLVQEARKRYPAIATAFMTGHLGVSARCETALDPSTPVLIKPFTPSLLEERVREALALGLPAPARRIGAH